MTGSGVRARLHGITERLAAATPGPWRVAKGRSESNWIDAGQYAEVLAPASVECMAYCYGGSSRIELSDADAVLIAAAPSDLAACSASLLAVLALADEADAEGATVPPSWIRRAVAAHLDPGETT